MSTFDVNYYLQGKADALNASGKTYNGLPYTPADVQRGFDEVGLTAQQHYERYGQAEGISPYSDFNENYYLQSKAALLNAKGVNPATNQAWTSEDVKNTFSNAGINYLQHYEAYGKAEGVNGYATQSNNYNNSDTKFYTNDTAPATIPTATTAGTAAATTATTASAPSTTVTIPDFPANQATMNAETPSQYSDLMSNIPKFDTAYDNLANLPGMIDDWTSESLKRQRVTGDQATDVFNQVASQRAGTGIMGGTETQNLEANAQANLSGIILENQNTIQNTADQLKAGTYQQTPAQALMPVDSGINLYGTTASEAASWGNTAMNTLLGSY